MNESQWIAALDRSDNLKPVAVGNHKIGELYALLPRGFVLGFEHELRVSP